MNKYINEKDLIEKKGMLGDDLLVEIIDMFLESFPDTLNNIEENIKNTDFESLIFNAHSFKNDLGNFGSSEVVDLAFQLEKKGRDKDTSGLEELFKNTKIIIEHLADELKEFKNQ
ncbi:MAG: Hpt domain-containing protein [Bacteroidales bacterium]|nr:Hpt domain-containing protein [Bacteroidales bacterium]